MKHQDFVKTIEEQVTSIDWSNDHIRMTTYDFRTLFFKKEDKYIEVPFVT